MHERVDGIGTEMQVASCEGGGSLRSAALRPGPSRGTFLFLLQIQLQLLVLLGEDNFS